MAISAIFLNAAFFFGNCSTFSIGKKHLIHVEIKIIEEKLGREVCVTF